MNCGNYFSIKAVLYFNCFLFFDFVSPFSYNSLSTYSKKYLHHSTKLSVEFLHNNKNNYYQEENGRVQPNMFTFSMRALIWVNQKIVSELSQPKFLSFVHWNSPRHNSLFEICRGLFLYLVCKLTYSFSAIIFVVLPKIQISIFTSQNIWWILWESSCSPLGKRVQGIKIISYIHQKS